MYTLDNFVRSTLAVAATATDTSLVVALAAPPLRDPPTPSADAPGVMVLQDETVSPNQIEIVTYTGVSTSGTRVTLSGVTRAQEGTSAQSWDVGAQTFGGMTSGVAADLQSQIDDKVAASGGSTTLWTGTSAEYDALSDATKNASGFVAVVST